MNLNDNIAYQRFSEWLIFSYSQALSSTKIRIAKGCAVLQPIKTMSCILIHVSSYRFSQLAPITNPFTVAISFAFLLIFKVLLTVGRNSYTYYQSSAIIKRHMTDSCRQLFHTCLKFNPSLLIQPGTALGIEHHFTSVYFISILY